MEGLVFGNTELPILPNVEMRWVYLRDFWYGKEMRGVPLPKSSFLPPSLHSKPMTSGVSGGRDQPIGVELRTELSLSPFCCSGRSATKEGCCGLIPINLPRAEACKHCHRTVRPLVESSGTVGAVTPQCWGVWSEF